MAQANSASAGKAGSYNETCYLKKIPDAKATFLKVQKALAHFLVTAEANISRS